MQVIGEHMTSWTKSMTWATAAAVVAVASALLLTASGVGWHERLARESRGVLRQIGLMPPAKIRDPTVPAVPRPDSSGGITNP